MLRLKMRTKVLGDPLIWWERRRKPYGVEGVEVEEENEGDDAKVEEENEGAGGPIDMDSGDLSQPDPLAGLGDTKSTRAATGRIQGTVVSLIRNPGRPWRHQVKPSCNPGRLWRHQVKPSCNPGRPRRRQVKLSCNPGTHGPGVPKLVRQMSSALTKMIVNWMSVDIGITEGNNRSWLLTVV
ncbi:hypothetical protein L3X38_017976 [Prunus dulcis]|uniref:Uncharacterized protein n=1 Tax=Prunus dulcis TaxID=3755 RepID=A0AAD4W9Y4_PRUDU|nr:hypothetical protein L3X38_017976 [Prunus dulcis]